MGRRIRLAPPQFQKADIGVITRSISAVLRSGWLTSGPLVGRLEAKLVDLTGTRYVVAMNSCTASLHAIAASLGLRSSDEVVVPANTFASTANAVLYVGAKPVLADCDIDSFNVTAESVEDALTRKTKAIFVTHVAGNPCEMDPIVSLSRGKGLKLIEDVAHAAGGIYRGGRCGSFGLASAFSFYPTKIITSGEGGAVGTNSKLLRNFARIFRNVGRAAFGSGPIVKLGYNYRMSDVHAAIGLSQLRHIWEFISKRNGLATLYDELLDKIEWIIPQAVANYSKSTYYSYIIRVLPSAPVSRDKLAARLLREGIETTVMFRPLYKQPYFHRFVTKQRLLPNAEMVGRTTLALPMHSGLSESDVEYVVKAIRRV